MINVFPIGRAREGARPASTESKHKPTLGEAQAIWDAINRSHAVIQFEPSGVILWANDAFLAAVGYRLDEIKGRHHSMFVEPDVQHDAGMAHRAGWFCIWCGIHGD